MGLPWKFVGLFKVGLFSSVITMFALIIWKKETITHQTPLSLRQKIRSFRASKTLKPEPLQECIYVCMYEKKGRWNIEREREKARHENNGYLSGIALVALLLFSNANG